MLALGIGMAIWALWGVSLSAVAEASSEPTVVLESADGQPFARKGPFKGKPIARDELPDHLVAAVLSVEDRRFYRHMGIDFLGIARAAVRNLGAGRVVEGGSTITQQLARVLFLTQDRTLKRKVGEALLALWLELRLSKDEILTRYLGNIYVGSGAVGIPAAARIYFDKEIEELTLAESAVLAGLIKAPSDLNPIADPKAARERAAVVLDAMVAAGTLSEDEAQAAKAAPAKVRRARLDAGSGGWFADWVYGEAAELAGPFNGILEVRTSLHPRLQEIAEKAVARVMEREGAKSNAGQAALVAMLPDGAVLAMVGGRDYETNAFNRAVQAKRQPGSTFKLFVYYAALRNGWTLRDRIDDEPIEIDGWRPENYDGRYFGRVTLAEAFARSLNAATVRLAQEVGLDEVIAAARDLGIDADMTANASLALGATEVSLLDLTGAYASVRAGRAPVEPWGILDFGAREQDQRYRLGATTPPARDLGEAQMPLVQALKLVVDKGTGKAARLRHFAAGKTGTSQDYRDAWFVGFTGPLVAGVWVGNDDNSPMDEVTGGGLPAKIWRAFMNDALALLARGDDILQPHEGTRPAAGDGQGDARIVTRGRRTRAMQCNVRACERAYRSFRRSDCTFQPYSGPRKLCTK